MATKKAPKRFEARRVSFVEGKRIEMPPIVFHLDEKAKGKSRRRKVSD